MTFKVNFQLSSQRVKSVPFQPILYCLLIGCIVTAPRLLSMKPPERSWSLVRSPRSGWQTESMWGPSGRNVPQTSELWLDTCWWCESSAAASDRAHRYRWISGSDRLYRWFPMTGWFWRQRSRRTALCDGCHEICHSVLCQTASHQSRTGLSLKKKKIIGHWNKYCDYWSSWLLWHGHSLLMCL